MTQPNLDRTNDPNARSWVETAQGHPQFPIQNLPFGVFSPPGSEEPRGSMAIGDAIFDIAAAVRHGLFEDGIRQFAEAASGADLMPLFALGSEARRSLRLAVFDILSVDAPQSVQVMRSALLHVAAECRMHLPAKVQNFTDFFCGIHHAANGGRRRSSDPDLWLTPNYRHMPIAYHGRASSVRVSGTPLRRPSGQSRQIADANPVFGLSKKLDYEFELGVWIGSGNRLGEPIPIGEAGGHIFGYCILNDWSARDIQMWEMPPLGAFLSKNMMTSVSPWIVTPEALAPFVAPAFPRGEKDPSLLDYLHDGDDQAHGRFDILLETLLETEQMRSSGMPPHQIGRANATDLYWTFAQMVAHHTSGGCNIGPGDIFGTGTISAESSDGGGSIIELSTDGQTPIALPGGETRSFLHDGDEVIFRARCEREGFASIGFGECRGQVISGQT